MSTYKKFYVDRKIIFMLPKEKLFEADMGKLYEDQLKNLLKLLIKP